jgi:hypothetical protein
MAVIVTGSMRTTRIRDRLGLNVPVLVMEQAYSQMRQPMHLSGSQMTCS